MDITTRYILALSIVSAGVLTIQLMRRFVLLRLVNYVSRHDNTFSPKLLRKCLRSLQVLFFIVLLALSINILQIPQELDRYVSLVVMLCGVFFAVSLAFALISFLLDAHLRRSDGDLSGFRGRTIMPMAKALVLIIASAFLLDNLGFKVTSIIAGLGIIGVAAGLAGQALLADFFAHFAILLDRTFGLGDFITVGDAMGTVEYIGLKSTRIRSLNGERIILPNAWLAKATIKNYNDMPSRRHECSFLVDHSTTPDMLEQIPSILKGIVEKQEGTTFERAHLIGYTPMGFKFELVFQTTGSDYIEYLDVNQAVQLEFLIRLKELDVELASPVTVLDQ